MGSTVAEVLAQELRSPIRHIQADWFFKARLPKCPKSSACWELPASVDCPLMVSELRRIAGELSAKTVPSITLQGTNKRKVKLDLPGVVGTRIVARPVVIVVEGFVLFAEPSLVELMSNFIWLDMDSMTGAVRRYLRSRAGPGPPDESNPAFRKWKKEGYDGHIYQHYEELKTLQLENVERTGRPAVRIDASLAKDVVLQTALDHVAGRSEAPEAASLDR